MSRAFVKESDGGVPEEPIAPLHELPLTAKNYVTPESFAKLQAELQDLTSRARPETAKALADAAAASLDLEVQPLKRRMREIDARIQYLTLRIQHAQVVANAARRETDQVFFGAAVTFRNRKGDERTVRIVGVDESDPARGLISFVSPLAKALMKSREGDTMPFVTPGGGKDELEVISVTYP